MWCSENMIQHISLALQSIYLLVLSFQLKTGFVWDTIDTLLLYHYRKGELDRIRGGGNPSSALIEWVPYMLIFNKRFWLLVDYFKCWEIHYFLGQPPSILTMQIAKNQSLVSVLGRMGFQS